MGKGKDTKPKKTKTQSKKSKKGHAKTALTGATAANFHEAGRSEYLAHYVFSSFGTSVPVPRQEDTGLDLYCTLTERVGQRLWPTASYCVQVKSTPDPWEFLDQRSVQWIVEHPLPVFLCVVNKKSATLSIYHTSPRFAAWINAPKLNKLVMLPGVAGVGYGMPWEQEEYKIANEGEFPLSAPIAEFTLTQILDDDFHSTVKQILANWIQKDRENIFRIQAGLRQFTTISTYQTNDSSVKGTSRSWRTDVDDEERQEMLKPFVEQAKWLSQHLSERDDMRGYLRLDLLLRHLNALNWVEDGVFGFHLLSRLKQHFENDPNVRKQNFYAGLDGLSLEVDRLTDTAMKEASELAAKDAAAAASNLKANVGGGGPNAS